jgi:hypothetical protein
MNRICLIFLLLLHVSFVFAQENKQVIRGTVRDKESKMPLPGASVVLTGDTTAFRGATTDERGEFRIEKVTPGLHSLKVSFIGYKPSFISGLLVTSGKEVIVTVDIEESLTTMKEVEITAFRKDKAINEMAVVSARTFAVEETDRYAGSRGDPARMASNFAGVQGANDTRNDIVVRGNTPMGILWRLEGIDIPNPNHFAVQGSTGGPVSILNNKVLANSDFYTGAFPAEYGNGIAGVFDVLMRPGNNQKHEFTGQFGFLGTELTAEGPLSKGSRASYLVNFRYSTLKMFDALKIPIGTSAVPNYRDGAFKLNFPTKKGNLTFFGIGGKSNIDIILSKQTEQTEEIYGDKDRDQYFGSSMGVVGTSYTHFHNGTTFSKITIAGSFTESKAKHDYFERNSDYSIKKISPILDFNGLESKGTISYFVNKKFNARHSAKAGIFVNGYNFNMHDSTYREDLSRFITRVDVNRNSFMVQPYISWKYKLSEKFELTSGLHAQVFNTINTDRKANTSVEPRAGLKYLLNDKHNVSFGAGLHSQMQPFYIYFQQYSDTGNIVRHNQNLNFTRSSHYVLSYDYFIGQGLRFKTETYYQYLYGVPVEVKSSAFTIVNQGSGFSRFFPDSLANRGTGRNYGIEFTLEKFFSKGTFFLVSASVFDSKYRGSDGVLRNTDFNNQYVANFLLGKEFKTAKNNAFGISKKVTAAGGRRYTPIDEAASAIKGEAVFVDSLTNTLKFRDYLRTDFRIYYRINRKNISHEIAFDLINVFNIKNVLALTYVPDPENPSKYISREEYQLGFLPLFYYKVDF